VKRRDGVGAVPADLITFDGRGLSAAEWVEAYEAWCDARDQWESEHPGVVLPDKRTLSRCPFDPEML
jgi:hypothetical protein